MDYEGVDWTNIKDHNAFLNTLYYRGYGDYYFVEVSIGLNTPPKLRNIFKILKKKVSREKVTRELIKVFELEDFPYYEQ